MVESTTDDASPLATRSPELAERSGHGCVRPDALIFQALGGGPLRRRHFRSRVWVPACARAGLVGVGLHDLRRTNATILVALGTSIRDAQEPLGHDDPRVLLRVHTRATETGKRAAVDGVSAALGPADGRQRTTSNDGGRAIDEPWPPPPAPARCDRCLCGSSITARAARTGRPPGHDWGGTPPRGQSRSRSSVSPWSRQRSQVGHHGRVWTAVPQAAWYPEVS